MHRPGVGGSRCEINQSYMAESVSVASVAVRSVLWNGIARCS